MSRLRRIVMVRHGETNGESSIRFHGSGDPELSDLGKEQMRRAEVALRADPIDLVMASPLRRSWRSAWIVGSGTPVRLESAFREVDFGRWEGLTREEIEASDPGQYAEWQADADDFRYPNGESRQEFRTRVFAGLERLLAESVNSALLVIHKGVIRAIAQQLTGEAISRDEPALGAVLEFTRRPDDSWYPGRTSSNPPGLDAL